MKPCAILSRAPTSRGIAPGEAATHEAAVCGGVSIGVLSHGVASHEMTSHGMASHPQQGVGRAQWRRVRIVYPPLRPPARTPTILAPPALPTPPADAAFGERPCRTWLYSLGSVRRREAGDTNNSRGRSNAFMLKAIGTQPRYEGRTASFDPMEYRATYQRYKGLVHTQIEGTHSGGRAWRPAVAGSCADQRHNHCDAACRNGRIRQPLVTQIRTIRHYQAPSGPSGPIRVSYPPPI